MEDSKRSISLPSGLLCNENEGRLSLDETKEQEGRFFPIDFMGHSETDDEYIEMLVNRERTHSCGSLGYASDHCLVDNWLRSAYLDAVQWILKMRTIFGFSFKTAYLSVTYLYQFLLCHEVDISGKSWAIRLLSVACLSLAVKMEECKIPALSEFQMDDCNFEKRVIRRMEILVLNALEWRMSFVTPFAYLNYFISKFSDESRSKTLLSRVIGLISDTMRVINLMNYRPSEIAAAAVLVSFDHRLTRRSIDFKMGAISLNKHFKNDHVFACYNLMLEFEKRKMKILNAIISPDLSSTNPSSVDVLDAAREECLNTTEMASH